MKGARKAADPCPRPDDLIAYVDGSLPHERRAALLAHVADCDDCRRGLNAVGGSVNERASRFETAVRPDGVPTAANAMIGEAVGNYIIREPLGSGGMGLVFLAEHPDIGRRAAVKIIHPDSAREDELVRRFLTEARAAAAIRHPHIVDVFDLGRLDNGRPYILMELLEGCTLRTTIARRGPLPLEVVLEVLSQVSGALEASHAKGIIHRDLKPDNIFIVDDPARPQAVICKVLDFGIAKLAVNDGLLRTQSGALLGTPLYMALEQFAGAEKAGPATDQYALAAIVFEMLTARPPYSGASIVDLIDKQRAGDRQRLAVVRGDLPRALDEVLDRALAPDPDQRFPSVAAFAEAFRTAARVLPADPPKAQRGRRPWLLGTITLLGLGAAATVLMQRRTPPPRLDTPPPVVTPAALTPARDPEPVRALVPDASPAQAAEEPAAVVAPALAKPKREKPAKRARKPKVETSEPEPI